MSWVKLDDQFPDHPKLASIGPLAGWVYVSGLCYAARYLTDGFIPLSVAERFAGSSPEVRANLCRTSLWVQTEFGYQIHDYLDYNPPAAQVKTERAAAKARMAQKRASDGPEEQCSPEVRPNFTRSFPVPSPSPSPSSSPIPSPVKGSKLETVEKGGMGGEQTEPPAAATLSPFFAAAITRFENSICMIPSPDMKDDLCEVLGQLESRGLEDWWQLAILQAEKANARSWKYVRAVLEACLRTGRPPGSPRPDNGRGRSRGNAPDADKPGPGSTAEQRKAYYVPEGYEGVIEH